MFMTPRTAAELYAELWARVEARDDVVCTTHPLVHEAGTWDFLRLASVDIGPDGRVVVVRATIHGDEVAGALTVMNHLDVLVDRAHSRGLKLVVYPLGNPSGYDRGVRYNADHHMGEGNNDFLRYVLEDGSVTGDLGAGESFRSWMLADEPALGIDLPAESRLMLELVRQDPNEQVVAAFDLHQDFVTEGLGPCAYHYAFGDLSRYDDIVAEVAEVAPLLVDFDMAGGFGEQIDDAGNVLARTAEEASQDAVRSDQHGFIVRHDGSFSDFYHRLGVPHSIAIETSGATPIQDACRVNLIWIAGVMDLIAG